MFGNMGEKSPNLINLFQDKHAPEPIFLSSTILNSHACLSKSHHPHTRLESDSVRYTIMITSLPLLAHWIPRGMHGPC